MYRCGKYIQNKKDKEEGNHLKMMSQVSNSDSSLIWTSLYACNQTMALSDKYVYAWLISFDRDSVA